ncbi:hypothetical protein J2Z48_000899 [Croceifilum oryzae]|uniref:Uncharacterized protein n=1 Tax=Croceifilum oryzae TaxID=1553429 RepID=A0AAJ1THP3_9BACL|nr:hypothetical protein [Croceifilum oryzae]MDQ0416732.1 hypothetical protein [Croceifilum oryzae]
MSIRLSDRLVDFPTHSIVCFMHAWAVNNWIDIVDSQLKRLCSSGLYQKLDAIFLNIVTDQIDDTSRIEEDLQRLGIDQYDDTLQYVIKPDAHEWEKSTLLWLHEYSTVNKQNVRVLYLHTKGVRHFGQATESNVADWRNMLETLLIDHHSLALECLEKVDVSSLQYTPGAVAFAGNFWWAHSRYLKELTTDIPSVYPPIPYLAQELWILSKYEATFCNLFHSGLDVGAASHYFNAFPSERIPTHFTPAFFKKIGSQLELLDIP